MRQTPKRAGVALNELSVCQSWLSIARTPLVDATTPPLPSRFVSMLNSSSPMTTLIQVARRLECDFTVRGDRLLAKQSSVLEGRAHRCALSCAATSAPTPASFKNPGPSCLTSIALCRSNMREGRAYLRSRCRR